MRILVFGDSVAYGAWDREGGWVERLKQHLHKRTVNSGGAKINQVFNLGIGGDASTQILARLPAEIEARRSTWPFMLIFMLGGNDEKVVDGQVETPLAQFQTNITSIISQAKKETDKIVFIGIPPLPQPVVHFKTYEYSNQRRRQYEQKLAEVVGKQGTHFVSLRDTFEKVGLPKLFAYDNLHPNDAGHQLIFKLLKPEIDKLL